MESHFVGTLTQEVNFIVHSSWPEARSRDCN